MLIYDHRLNSVMLFQNSIKRAHPTYNRSNYPSSFINNIISDEEHLTYQIWFGANFSSSSSQTIVHCDRTSRMFGDQHPSSKPFTRDSHFGGRKLLHIKCKGSHMFQYLFIVLFLYKWFLKSPIPLSTCCYDNGNGNITSITCFYKEEGPWSNLDLKAFGVEYETSLVYSIVFTWYTIFILNIRYFTNLHVSNWISILST